MVLILIVVDDGLVHRILLKDSLANAKVLILIVVDNGLVPVSFTMKQFIHFSLNPCCNGRWSRTY